MGTTLWVELVIQRYSHVPTVQFFEGSDQELGMIPSICASVQINIVVVHM